MCNGIRINGGLCPYESASGINWGDCHKPFNKVCPAAIDIDICKWCGKEEPWELIVHGLCDDCQKKLKDDENERNCKN